MDLTVTIVTRNRAESLKEGLISLKKQVYAAERYEVIVVDNGSTDHTRDIAEAMADSFTNFTYVHDPRPGQLVGYHRALQAAKGRIACFIDDDVRPSESWLAGLASSYKEPNVGLATGPIKLEFEADRPAWLDHMELGEPGGMTLPFLGLLDCGSDAREIPTNLVWGSNFSARRDLLLRVGGFHPTAMPSDLLHFHGDGEIYPGRAIAEAGYVAVYNPAATVRHIIPEERLTLEAVVKKFETTGYARSFQALRQTGVAYPKPTEAEIIDITSRYFRDWRNAPGDLKQAVLEGLTYGIRQHLKYFTDDQDFRRWVLRDNYLDLERCYNHPDLINYQARVKGAEQDWRSGT